MAHSLSIMFWVGLLVVLGLGLRGFIRENRAAIVAALKMDPGNGRR